MEDVLNQFGILKEFSDLKTYLFRKMVVNR